jgi:anti-anti-sigma regulatory factor
VRVETAVTTKTGRRFHAIDLHALRDPVSGTPGALIEQTDITARIEAESTATERLRIVQSQHQEILVLAAPILDVGLGTIAVPIIGALNIERVQTLSYRLLQALVERRARRVILDLTGIAGIDDAGVSALAQLLEAIRLLGATPIITGIGAQLARQLTNSGIQLAQFLTRRSLAEAITHLGSF